MDLSSFEEDFANNQDFEISEDQYEGRVGKSLPNTNYYITHTSRLAQLAAKAGFKIQVETRTFVETHTHRVLVFKKI